MQRHPTYTRKRIHQLAARLWDRVYPESRPLEDLRVHGPIEQRISYDEAQRLEGWREARLGEQFAPPWSTWWFRARAVVPESWAGHRVDLRWVTHCESTLWIGGRSIQGLNSSFGGDRSDAILTRRAAAGESIEFQLELACNSKFGGVTPHYRTVSPFLLDRAEIARFDPAAWDLYWDLHVLAELEAEQEREPRDLDRAWAGLLLAELNRFCNAIDETDPRTWPAAREILQGLLTHRNATTAHELSAIGHAHIDTAWLWPLAETHRKCERTFSSQTRYMEEYPEYRFACSQAYQYEAIRQRNPDLFARIRAAIERGQWVVVGGSWIEPDCNIPSGESLLRQFIVGQRYFQEHFGRRCREFWNPDVFGYNGQLPQICRLAGIDRFLTQKLSWNAFNKPQHHTFTWEGIDGSALFTHFPPADTYNAECSIAELRRNARNYKDHDRSRHSLLVYGFGDGGGGPTRDMLERLRRCDDLQGMPRTRLSSSDEFFDRLERDCADRVRIVGELYFEYHRGTYTTQAATKRGNRQCEFMLHDVEMLSALAGPGFAYPREQLQELWRIVLLNQFHDILPGSSIALVYEDAQRHHAEVLRRGAALRQSAAAALVGTDPSSLAALNTAGVARREVVDVPGGGLRVVEAAPCAIGAFVEPDDAVRLVESAGRVILENGHLRATLDARGRLLSLLHLASGREAIAGEANRMELYEDRPTAWDAWDVDPQHLETRRDLSASASGVARVDPLRCEARFEYAVGRRSRMTQIVRLDAGSRRIEFHCDVDWQERKTFLKVAHDLAVRAMNATYEMQFGCVERPTHFNTSFDLARYEVPGHRFADLSEHGFGVALLSESKYGYSAFGSTLRMSLLRGAEHPDPSADLGRHAFAYALYPHEGGWQGGGVVAEALRFNLRPLLVPGRASPRGFVRCDDANLLIDTVKRAEDSDALIVRLYECHGARGTARLRIDPAPSAATFCNALEEEDRPAEVRDGAVIVPFEPYKIITVKAR